MSNPFGIDVSSYQGVIDWDVVAQKKFDFVGIRGGLSWAGRDRYFLRNWEEAKARGIPRFVYHVVFSGQKAKRQMDNLFGYLPENDMGELPISLDFERDFGQSKKVITAELLECAHIIKERTGREMMPYSSANWINSHTNVGSWVNRFDWFIAHYGYQNAPRDLPPALPTFLNRQRCIIHQFTPLGDGKENGMQSAGLDLNRWQFDREHFLAYIKAEPVEVVDYEAKYKELYNENIAIKALLNTSIEENAELKAENEEMRTALMDIREITDKWY